MKRERRQTAALQQVRSALATLNRASNGPFRAPHVGRGPPGFLLLGHFVRAEHVCGLYSKLELNPTASLVLDFCADSFFFF